MEHFFSLFFSNTPVFYLTQSLWRDEAFSYFLAVNSVWDIIRLTANDFNPPLYYITLHFWILLFGRSEIAMRLLSFVFHLGLTYVAFLTGRKINRGSFPVFLSLFTFLNPMLMYYGLEIRMYSMYAFFAFLAVYFYLSGKKFGYIIASALGMYTHTFFIMIPFSFLVADFISGKIGKKNVQFTLSPVLFFLPWIPVVANQFLRSENSWLYPVDAQLITSVLSNLFTGYDGTPGDLWGISSLISTLIIIFIALPLKNKRLSPLFWVPLFLPLFTVLSYSIIKRPIFVNRYMIFSTIFLILSLSVGIYYIKNRATRLAVAAIWLVFASAANLYFPPFKKKTDFKKTFLRINTLADKMDTVYSKTPIGFLESAYYYRYPEKVFVYNPDMVEIPNYIGITAVFNDVSKPTFPSEGKVFLVDDNAEYEIFREEKQ